MGSYYVIFLYTIIVKRIYSGFYSSLVDDVLVINVECYLITTNSVSEQHSAYCLSVKKNNFIAMCTTQITIFPGNTFTIRTV